MAENLLSKNQKGTTPAFREGWDRTFCNWLTEDEIDKELRHLSCEIKMREHDKEMQKYTERRIFTGK